MPKTNIQIDTQTWADLAKEGKFGESFDQVIKRLLIELAVWRKGRTR